MTLSVSQAVVMCALIVWSWTSEKKPMQRWAPWKTPTICLEEDMYRWVHKSACSYPSHISEHYRLPVSCFLRSKAKSWYSVTWLKHAWITGRRLWSIHSGCRAAPPLTGTATCLHPEASTCWSRHSWPRWPMMWPLPWPNKACESPKTSPSAQSTVVPFSGVTVHLSSLWYLWNTTDSLLIFTLSSSSTNNLAEPCRDYRKWKKLYLFYFSSF